MSETAADPTPDEVRTPRGVVLRGTVGCNGVPLRLGAWAAVLGPMIVSVRRIDAATTAFGARIDATVSVRTFPERMHHATFGVARMDEALAWIDNRVEDLVDETAKGCEALMDAVKAAR